MGNSTMSRLAPRPFLAVAVPKIRGLQHTPTFNDEKCEAMAEGHPRIFFQGLLFFD